MRDISEILSSIKTKLNISKRRDEKHTSLLCVILLIDAKLTHSEMLYRFEAQVNFILRSYLDFIGVHWLTHLIHSEYLWLSDRIQYDFLLLYLDVIALYCVILLPLSGITLPLTCTVNCRFACDEFSPSPCFTYTLLCIDCWSNGLNDRQFSQVAYECVCVCVCDYDARARHPINAA